MKHGRKGREHAVNGADENQAGSDSIQRCGSLMKPFSAGFFFLLILSLHRDTCVFVSYVFIVVKTHVRTFAVSGILGQLARIRAFG